jgi:hypothetical protein
MKYKLNKCSNFLLILKTVCYKTLHTFFVKLEETFEKIDIISKRFIHPTRL